MNLRNFFERTFDARRVKRNHDEYDHRRCYQDYHAYCCRHASSREGFHSLASEASIEQHGLVPINGLLAPAIARELLENAIEVGELSLLKKNSRDLIGYRLRDITSVTRLLESVISDRVDTLSRTYFGCEYLVHWFMIAMTPPTRRPASVSFLWHCDKGPRAHLKLMVYLNDADEHGGGTAFLDRNDSAAVEASGYLFGAAKKRTTDLKVLSARTGRDLAALELHPSCGDAVLFQPTSIVHSGITPTRGPRYTLTLCLLPSPLPWAEALRYATLSDLMEEDLWHEDAMSLLQKMGLPDTSR